MDAAALLIQHQDKEPALTVENVKSSSSSDLLLRDCMWDASYLMGCFMHPLQVLVPAVPKELGAWGWHCSC